VGKDKYFLSPSLIRGESELKEDLKGGDVRGENLEARCAAQEKNVNTQFQ